MYADFLEFVVALYQKGNLLFTGLFGAVVGTMIGLAWGGMVPWSVWFSIGFLVLFASCFLVWRDTRKELGKARNLLDQIPEMKIGFEPEECIKQLEKQVIYCVTVRSTSICKPVAGIIR